MFDIIIIGAGPGGYETAADAAAHGLTVAIVERDQMGGTCLNRGCIPTKALCRNAEVINLMREAEVWGVKTGEMAFDYAPVFERKEAVVKQLREGVEMLMGAPGITAIKGEAILKDANTVVVNGEEYQAKNIIIATGSAPRGLPIEGADLAMTSDDILAMETLPKSLCIVGGGVIGMEFAAVFSTFGVEVTVIEYCKEILPPFDKDVAKRLKSVLSKRGIKIITSAAVNGISQDENGYTVTYQLKGKPQSVTCEKVLMSVGRQPVLPQGLDAVGVAVGRRGIEVDDNMMTNVKGVYAIGDVNGRMMLAHAATFQGLHVINNILGKEDNICLDLIPAAIFTLPEAACVGMTEEQCKSSGMAYTCRKGYYRANGKALAMDETEGFVKLMADGEGRIIGCHLFGAHAADLVQEVSSLMALGATTDQLRDIVHIHPTLSEILQEMVM